MLTFSYPLYFFLAVTVSNVSSLEITDSKKSQYVKDFCFKKGSYSVAQNGFELDIRPKSSLELVILLPLPSKLGL